jgi:hypothetical protein
VRRVVRAVTDACLDADEVSEEAEFAVEIA